MTAKETDIKALMERIYSLDESVHPIDLLRIFADGTGTLELSREDAGEIVEVIDAFAEAIKKSVRVPPLDRPSYGDPHEFLLLASYCGEDTPGCTNQRPCVDCLAMCNIFGEDGAYLRQLGEPVAQVSAQDGAGVKERSEAIREFCQKAGILGSVEADGLPDDVRQFRLDAALRAAARSDGQ